MPKVEKGSSQTTRLFSAVEKKYPQHKQLIQLARTFTETGMYAMDAIYPIGVQIYEKCLTVSSRAQEHQLSRILPILTGLALCFFGGCFTVLITLLEVVHLTCWDRIKKSCRTLQKNYLAAREASRKDSMLDEDNNGIPDVEEISGEELFSRKLKVFLNSVDIVAVNEAVNALILAFLAITAALLDRMSCALAFGCSVADVVKQFFHLDKLIEDALPPEQKKLAETISNTILNFLCMVVTIALQRYAITAFCAARGANMILENAFALQRELAPAEENKKRSILLAVDTPQYRALFILLAVMGFAWQAYHGFALPFPINILLLPITFADWFLGIVFRASASFVRA